MSSQMKDIRRQMEEDEDLNTLMRGLRGQVNTPTHIGLSSVQLGAA